MGSEHYDWTYEWAGLIRSHTDSITLLQYAIDALQAKLPDEYATTLWVLSTKAGEWIPVVLGRNNPLREQSWAVSKAVADAYVIRLKEAGKVTVYDEASCFCHPVLATRDACPLDWYKHWLCGEGEAYIGVLELGGEVPDVTDQETMESIVQSCLATLQRITETPLFSIDTFTTTPLPQSKSYDALAEEERLMTLGKLVASVTHEINSPLGVAITGLSHLKEALNELNSHFNNGTLTESLFRNFVEESDDVAELLAFNLERAVKLIGDFKANAVNQSADQAINFELQKVIQSTTNSLVPELKRYGIHFEISAIPECVMTSYPGALSQIITNLVFNSINHAFAGVDEKRITLKVTMDTTNQTLSLCYRDNGNGIPEKDQQAVFEPYFTTRRESGGSGLGLSIVKALATGKLKGTLTFKSETAKGVEFLFTFPIDVASSTLPVQ